MVRFGHPRVFERETGQKAGGPGEGGYEMPDIGVADGEVDADGGSERDHPGQSDGLMQVPRTGARTTGRAWS